MCQVKVDAEKYPFSLKYFVPSLFLLLILFFLHNMSSIFTNTFIFCSFSSVLLIVELESSGNKEENLMKLKKMLFLKKFYPLFGLI